MFRIQNINKKIIYYTIILILTTSCSKNNYTNIKMGDIFWKMESIRSEKINNSNNYCILYSEFNKSIYNKKGITEYDVEYLGFKIYDFLKLKGTKTNIKYLEETIEKAKINKRENKNFINNLEQQEIKNNYKNCDYLIKYDVWRDTTGKHIKTYYTAITISIFDIRRVKTTSDYLLSLRNNSLFNKLYPKLENNIVDTALEKWWKKYQE